MDVKFKTLRLSENHESRASGMRNRLTLSFFSAQLHVKTTRLSEQMMPIKLQMNYLLIAFHCVKHVHQCYYYICINFIN